MYTTFYHLSTNVQMITTEYLGPGDYDLALDSVEQRVEKVIYFVFSQVILTKRLVPQVREWKITFSRIVLCYNVWMEFYNDTNVKMLTLFNVDQRARLEIEKAEPLQHAQAIALHIGTKTEAWKTINIEFDKVRLGQSNGMAQLALMLQYVKPQDENYMWLIDFWDGQTTLEMYELLLRTKKMPSAKVLDAILDKIDPNFWEQLLAIPLQNGVILSLNKLITRLKQESQSITFAWILKYIKPKDENYMSVLKPWSEKSVELYQTLLQTKVRPGQTVLNYIVENIHPLIWKKLSLPGFGTKLSSNGCKSKIDILIGGVKRGVPNSMESLGLMLQYAKPKDENYISVLIPWHAKSLELYELLLQSKTMPGPAVLDTILTKVDPQFWEKLVVVPLHYGVKPSVPACMVAYLRDPRITTKFIQDITRLFRNSEALDEIADWLVEQPNCMEYLQKCLDLLPLQAQDIAQTLLKLAFRKSDLKMVQSIFELGIKPSDELRVHAQFWLNVGANPTIQTIALLIVTQKY